MDKPHKHIKNLIIIENTPVFDDYFIIKCSDNTPIPDISAGQFAQIKIENTPSVLLRRPFSIHDFDKSQNSISFLIKKVGNGSTHLSHLSPGNYINVVFPLGNGFSYKDKETHTGRSLLIGGGVGIAPIYLLAKELYQLSADFDTLIGGKTKNDLLCLNDFNNLCTTYCTTEDCSSGTKGFVTNHKCMIDDIAAYDRIFCCGPMPMMKAVASIAKTHNINCEVSLENKMACGIGACLCCITPTNSGNQCVCSNGPVFNTKELLW